VARYPVTLGAVLGVAAARPSSAAAEPSPSGARSAEFLTWRAPVGCSTAAAVRERVSELLGEPELDLRHVQRVEGRVTEAASGWTLHLTVVDAHGRRERRLASDQCQDLAEAAAVAITLAFEAARAEAASAEALSAPGVTPEPEPRPALAEPPPVSDVTDPAAPQATPAPVTTMALGLEVLVDINSLPVVAPGLAVSGALRWSELRLAVFAAWLPDAEESVGLDQNVSFSLLSGGLRACYALGHGVVDTSLCAGAELGRLAASGSGLYRAQSVSDLWLAPQVGLELGVPLAASLGLHLRADAVFPLLRHAYAVNETQDVHETASVAARLAAGASLAF
jgi:hypothetical protein